MIEDPGQVVFLTRCPGRVPPARRAEAALALMAINATLALGSFDLDPADGAIRFRTCLDVRNGSLDEAWLEPVVFVNLATMAEHEPRLADLTVDPTG